jgi:hypothetical protein
MDETSRSDGTVGELGAQLWEDLDQLRTVLSQKREEIWQTFSSFVEEHPYGALGAAFTTGYVLAGGLFSRATTRLLGFGVRLAMGRMVHRVLVDGVVGVIATALGAPSRLNVEDVH